eukprot:3668188-Prorocentrum_lima.AAC.1
MRAVFPDIPHMGGPLSPVVVSTTIRGSASGSNGTMREQHDQRPRRAGAESGNPAQEGADSDEV